MQLSENVMKWVMRLYPPFLFQRIWVSRFEKGFRAAEVRIHRSFLNRNYNATIFGGTIFSAADPFYALMFDQILQRKGFKTIVWLKSATIQYLKPGRTTLFFRIAINDDEIQAVVSALTEGGKFVKTYPITIVDTNGETCAITHNEIYIRNIRHERAGQTINPV